MKYLKLNNSQFPQLGLGTAGIGDDAKSTDVVKTALDIGYRRFDTASMYENETAIGRALSKSDVNRNDIWITTKLWDGGNYSYDNTIEECHRSLDRLGLDYIDLYLHHWPVDGQRLESWTAMEQLVADGIVSNIGVSNYTIDHLEELLNHAEIPPALNQVEFNPFLYQQDLLAYCQDNDIILEAYSPFSKGKKLNSPEIRQLAAKYEYSTAQIILRWCIQLGLSVIPKASSSIHLNENINIFGFELTEADMNIIAALDENYRIEWDPTTVP